MKIKQSKIKKILISEIKNLDPITVFIEDFNQGAGEKTVKCYDRTWSNFWGAMGEGYSVQSFFVSCDDDYIIGKLSPSLRPSIYEDDESVILSFLKREILKLRRVDDITKDRARGNWEGLGSKAGCWVSTKKLAK